MRRRTSSGDTRTTAEGPGTVVVVEGRAGGGTVVVVVGGAGVWAPGGRHTLRPGNKIVSTVAALAFNRDRSEI
jgi:hypothetical protein